MAVFRKSGTRTGGIIAISCLVLVLIACGLLMLVDCNHSKKEIHKVVEDQGGKVLSIHKINLEQSPFLDTMESRKGNRLQYSNTFYKITYIKNNTELIAWYRSVNGVDKTTDYYDKPIVEKPENKGLIKTYGERWIFE